MQFEAINPKLKEVIINPANKTNVRWNWMNKTINRIPSNKSRDVTTLNGPYHQCNTDFGGSSISPVRCARIQVASQLRARLGSLPGLPLALPGLPDLPASSPSGGPANLPALHMAALCCPVEFIVLLPGALYFARVNLTFHSFAPFYAPLDVRSGNTVRWIFDISIHFSHIRCYNKIRNFC